jgi:dipeptidyl aminopeptidase/acylaminoacyl peptidase
VQDWGPAGILVARATTPFDHDLFLVDASTGAATHLTPHSGEVQYGSARLLEDGGVLCACDAGSQFARLAVLGGDGAPTFLTADDADVDEVAVGGERRAWVVNDRGWGTLFVDGHAVESLPAGIPTGLAFSPDGRRLALALVRPDEPGDVWVLDLDGPPTTQPPARRVTRSSRAGLPADALRPPALRHVTSFDGLQVPYFLYGPAEAPTLLWVHGGPESQERPALNPVIQYFQARGLTVAAPNVRGSTGYGRTYHHLDDVERRLDSVADVAALARALGAERGVPVGVMGGSYGGYMTLAAVTEHPDLWRAAVDVVGIANFVTFLERTGAYRRALREAEYGTLAHHRDLLERISPLRKVDRIRAPLLVIHGANDPRVPVEEAEQIVGAIRARGGVVEYLRYEDEGHGLVRLPNRIDAYTRVAGFLERHLLGR